MTLTLNCALVILVVLPILANCGLEILQLPKILEFQPLTKIPDDIPICRQNDPNLNECMKNSFEYIIPYIKKGMPEINIPPLDPLNIDKLSFQYDNGAINTRFAIKNVNIVGLSAVKIDKLDFKLNDNKFRMEIVAHLPSLQVEGRYKADIKFNDIKMTPKGSFNVSITNIELPAVMEGELYEHAGHTYLKLTSIDSEPELGDMKIHATGLLPDPRMNDIVLNFVNQYWRPFYKTMLPETRSTWEPLIINTVNVFYSQVPLEKNFPKN